MMLPRPRSRMRGATVLVRMKAPTRLMRSTSAKSAALMSRSGERRRTAAELTRTSTPPCSVRASATNRVTSASLPTSPLTAEAVPPALRMASTVSARGSGRRPKMTTLAPSAANSSAVARPMPLPPPATNATLPSSLAMIVAPAEGLHGTARTLGLSRRAPGGAEVHEGLIVVIGASGGYERFREVPDGLLTAQPLEPSRAEEDSAEHAPHIGVVEGGIFAVGEGEDGARRVAADAAQALEGGAVIRQAPGVAGHRLAGDAVQASRAPIIAEGAPRLRHVAGAGPGEVLQGRIAREELLIFRDDAIHLRLLEHDLRDEDAVGFARPAPGKVAAVACVPGEEASLEHARRRLVGELHAGQCGRERGRGQVDFREKHVKMVPCPISWP